MGLIKALTSSTSSTLGDQFKEFVTCPTIDNNVIVQRGIVHHGTGNTNPTEGIISNGSAIAVPEGMAMMIIENGEIKEFTAEAGTYTWNTSSEPSIFTGSLGQGIINTFKTIGKRFTYGGNAAKDQRVYYVNIKLIPGNTFGSMQPEVVYDPVYGSVEITYNGEYGMQVADPILLVNNVIGANPKDTLTYNDIFSSEGNNMLKSKFSQKISEAIAFVMSEKNISFNRVQGYKSEIITKMNELLGDEWNRRYGIVVGEITLRVNATEQSKKIIQDMDAEVARTTRMGEVYSNNMTGTMAAATAEAMKNASSNDNGSMMGFMGMNMASNAGSNVLNTVAGMQNTGNLKNCPNCGAQNITGKFCSNCGTSLE